MGSSMPAFIVRSSVKTGLEPRRIYVRDLCSGSYKLELSLTPVLGIKKTLPVGQGLQVCRIS